MSVTGWGDVITLTVEAAFAAGVTGSGVWDVSSWDDAEWGPDAEYVDISDYVRAIDTKYGRSREYDHYQAATATIVLNNQDARFSPQNLSGPYVVGGLTGVRPWRPVRIRVQAPYLLGIPSGDVVSIEIPTDSFIYAGYIESLTEEFPGTKDATVTLTLVDEIAKIAAFNGFEQASQGAGELAGVRIHRVLDNARISANRAIDAGSATMQATTLAQNAWAEVLLTADSDGGQAWADPNDGVKYESAAALWQNSRSNLIQATFGDNGNLGISDLQFSYSGDELVNVAAIARAGGTEQRATDEDSRSLYGDHQYSRDDLICESDSQVSSIAAQIVAERSEPELRVASFVIYPMSDPENLWSQAIARRLRDRVEVTIDHPSAATTIEREVFIDGIEHQIRPMSWKTTLRCASASAFPNAGQFGVWDSSNWDEVVYAY